MNLNDKWLSEIENDLSKEMKSMQNSVLQRASDILGTTITVSSLHGRIGGKNNCYVDSIKTQFLDFNDFFAQWIKGLIDTFDNEKAQCLKWNSEKDFTSRSSVRNVLLLQDEEILFYTQKFLERNFYKNIKARTRVKPHESLWQVWFGDKLQYGLIIAPEYTVNGWRIDKSEIRRADYDYWTVGHIMHTGFIDPNMSKPYKFNTMDEFYTFYLSILMRLSVSKYEKYMYEKYIDYLQRSAEVLNEPFLIPEFRYAGLENKHQYRLDFTVLNQHSSSYIGFELSPASTHMQVIGLKEKQYKVNEDLSKKWEKEMEKRNKYFDTFGISVKTFTDKQLGDIDACFEQVKEVLSYRPINKPSMKYELNRLKDLKLPLKWSRLIYFC